MAEKALRVALRSYRKPTRNSVREARSKIRKETRHEVGQVSAKAEPGDRDHRAQERHCHPRDRRRGRCHNERPLAQGQGYRAGEEPGLVQHPLGPRQYRPVLDIARQPQPRRAPCGRHSQNSQDGRVGRRSRRSRWHG